MTARYLEDFAVGQIYGSDRIRIDGDRIKSFDAEFDPQPFHLDEHAARDSIFRGLAASGWRTRRSPCGSWSRASSNPLAALSAPALTNSAGLTRCARETSCVVESEIDVRPSKLRPEQGPMKVRATTFNQDGKVVQVLVANMIVPRRRTQHAAGVEHLSATETDRDLPSIRRYHRHHRVRDLPRNRRRRHNSFSGG